VTTPNPTLDRGDSQKDTAVQNIPAAIQANVISAIRRAVLREREACAKLAEDHGDPELAQQIRARA
jgi:hypothetical protein